jgi:hypothetical protein
MGSIPQTESVEVAVTDEGSSYLVAIVGEGPIRLKTWIEIDLFAIFELW